jgi:hypothetical protein
MVAIAWLCVHMLRECFKSRGRLEAELPVLRHQFNVLRQRAPRRLHFHRADRALYRGYPSILDAAIIVRAEPVARRHRMGLVAYCGWKSSRLGGRPRIGKELHDLIRTTRFDWGT